MRSLSNVSLLEILPQSLRVDEQVIAAVGALDARFQEIADIIPKLNLMYAIDDLPEAWVDELAWQFHLDFYDATLPIEQKRELVKNSLAWHRRKGTPSAVEELIATVFGGDATLEEWFDYGGSPFYFRVSTSGAIPDEETLSSFFQTIEKTKNLRSRLDSVNLARETPCSSYLGILVSGSDSISLVVPAP